MKVIIMQGIPGSGKSTYARRIEGATIVSTDHYFMVDGQYRFDPTKLGEAHAWCMREFIARLLQRWDNCIVVDNTNTTRMEMSPYYLAARAFGCEVDVVRVLCDVETSIKRGTHCVPEHVVRNMERSMEAPPVFWEACYNVVGPFFNDGE